MKLFVLLIALMLVPFTSHAQNPRENLETIQGFYQACKNPAVTADGNNLCTGYVAGVSELMALNGYERQQIPETDSEARAYLLKSGMCPDGLPSAEAALQAFLNWAPHHPEAWGQPAIAGVVTALSQTWRCQN